MRDHLEDLALSLIATTLAGLADTEIALRRLENHILERRIERMSNRLANTLMRTLDGDLDRLLGRDG